MGEDMVEKHRESKRIQPLLRRYPCQCGGLTTADEPQPSFSFAEMNLLETSALHPVSAQTRHRMAQAQHCETNTRLNIEPTYVPLISTQNLAWNHIERIKHEHERLPEL